MEKYYVSGCIELEGTVGHVEDDTAEFFTLYEKKENGQSHALLDCVDRLSVEAAMAVYVERDALQEQVRALVDEGSQMLRLLTDISENHDEYVNQDEYLYAGVPMDYVSEINTYVSRDVNAENPFEATDAAIREIRAQVLDDMADDCEADWLDTYIDELRSSAARIRAGEQL